MVDLIFYCLPCITMQDGGKSRHFCIGVPDHTSSKPVGLIGREVPSLSKPNNVKPNDLKFLLRVECSDTKEQPFRRMEITSQFQVSEVPVYVVCFSVFWGCSRGFFSVGFDQQVEFHSVCCIRDDVLNYCTCEFQEVRQQPSFLSRTARQHTPQQFPSVLWHVTFTGAMEPKFSRPGVQLYAAS